MLLTLGRLTDADYGEQGLVAKFLIGLLFNEFADCNCELKAFREFARRTWDIKIGSEAAESFQVMNEFVANRAAPDSDSTRFDAFLVHADRWVCGIEAKYYDPLKADQISRERHAVCQIAAAQQYREARLLLVAPEAEFSHVASDAGRSDVRRGILANGVGGPIDRGVQVVSWETVLDIVASADPRRLAPEIHNWVAARNRDERYGLTLGDHPTVGTSEEWRSILAGQSPLPSATPCRRHSGDRQAGYLPSATVEELLQPCPDWIRNAYSTIIEAARQVVGSNLGETGRTSGWIVISKPGRSQKNDCLIYPTADHLAIIVDRGRIAKGQSGRLRRLPFSQYVDRNRFKHAWFQRQEANLIVVLVEREESVHDPELTTVVRQIFRSRGRQRFDS